LTFTRLAEATDNISSRYRVDTSLFGHSAIPVTSDSLEDLPLAEYAAEHRVDHTRFEGVSRNVEDGMQ